MPSIDSTVATRGYSTREVADLVGLTPDQVRHYVRRQLLQPLRGTRGEYRFAFQDVLLLRTAKGLLAAEITPRKANRALLKLQRSLAAESTATNPADGSADNSAIPQTDFASTHGEQRSAVADVGGLGASSGGQPRSLAALRIKADGAAVVICDDTQLWNAESGQGHLNFDAPSSDTPTASGSNKVAQLGHRNLIISKEPEELTSDEWYNLGLDLEEVEPKRAPDAYRRAIALDPKNADALVNLGRLFQMKGDLKNAKRYYEQALAAVSSHELAMYNMGTVFDELNETERAAQYYERAHSVPDAHYNMARISELQGDEVSALRHMRRYRQMLDAETDRFE